MTSSVALSFAIVKLQEKAKQNAQFVLEMIQNTKFLNVFVGLKALLTEAQLRDKTKTEFFRRRVQTFLITYKLASTRPPKEFQSPLLTNIVPKFSLGKKTRQ